MFRGVVWFSSWVLENAPLIPLFHSYSLPSWLQPLEGPWSIEWSPCSRSPGWPSAVRLLIQNLGHELGGCPVLCKHNLILFWIVLVIMLGKTDMFLRSVIGADWCRRVQLWRTATNHVKMTKKEMSILLYHKASRSWPGKASCSTSLWSRYCF